MAHIRSRKHAPRALGASLLAGLALGATFNATAASPAPDDKETLDRVKVYGARTKRYNGEASSAKFTQTLVDTTQTINVIGNDLFNEQGATSLTEALRNSPGVGTFYAGENGATSTGDAIYMRGFDTSGNIFVDGIRDLGAVSRDVFNVDQIEVTKGPAGTDTGRSSPTGSINLVTKRANLRDANSASLSVGTDDQLRGVADFNRHLSDSTALRVNLMAQDSGVPGRDRVHNDRWGVAASLGFGLDGPTRTHLDLLHVKQDNIPDGWVPTIGLPGYSSPDPTRPYISSAPRVDSTHFYGTTSDFDHVNADMATLRVEHMTDNGSQLRNITRWGRTSQDYMLTSFTATAANLKTPDPNDMSTWTLARSNPTFKDQVNSIVTNQTSLVTHFGEGAVRHDLSTGVEFVRETLDQRGVAPLNGTTWPAANLYHPDPNVTGLVWGHNGADSYGRVNTIAAYAFDTISFGEQWQVNGGLRFDRYDSHYRNARACIATVSATSNSPACNGAPVGTVLPYLNSGDSDTLVNWKVGALYKPTPASSLYANYAVSYQPPGGSTLELSGAANSPNKPGYAPQKTSTAEIGGKWSFSDDALLLTAALYDTRIENEVIPDPSSGTQYQQAGEKRVRGIELSAVGQLTKQWWVSAGYTKMDAEVLKGPSVARDGSNAVPYTPDRAFTAWTTYRFDNGLTLGGGARYSGEMKRGTDGAIGTPASTGDYWVFDAVASYAFSEALDVRLNLYNLADTDYVAAINKSGYRYTPGQPRSALLTFNVRF
ncbi:catecholate siderophore receptor Fiu [Lysobacter sp. TY2-98]|uniref:catecholate siderophore receptor Fiu n=1 Tax=Lysobacter sp. TY2-98 TaxID=2290922 RepID=UPI000E1FDE93|nr:catecholate siderophore receptor Fiu [Lysobacter sp. TY2-98]AXK71423.1 catecholate siderophore receptor Fiu [Lysobacter sp. TY2-98]